MRQYRGHVRLQEHMEGGQIDDHEGLLLGQSCRWLRATQTAGVDSEPAVGLELISTGSFLNVAACGSGRSVAVSPDGWKLNAYRRARQPINE